MIRLRMRCVFLHIWHLSWNSRFYLLGKHREKLFNLEEVEILVGILCLSLKDMIKLMPSYQKKLRILFHIDTGLLNNYKIILVTKNMKWKIKMLKINKEKHLKITLSLSINQIKKLHNHSQMLLLLLLMMITKLNQNLKIKTRSHKRKKRSQ